MLGFKITSIGGVFTIENGKLIRSYINSQKEYLVFDVRLSDVVTILRNAKSGKCSISFDRLKAELTAVTSPNLGYLLQRFDSFQDEWSHSFCSILAICDSQDFDVIIKLIAEIENKCKELSDLIITHFQTFPEPSSSETLILALNVGCNLLKVEVANELCKKIIRFTLCYAKKVKLFEKGADGFQQFFLKVTDSTLIEKILTQLILLCDEEYIFFTKFIVFLFDLKIDQANIFTSLSEFSHIYINVVEKIENKKDFGEWLKLYQIIVLKAHSPKLLYSILWYILFDSSLLKQELSYELVDCLIENLIKYTPLTLEDRNFDPDFIKRCCPYVLKILSKQYPNRSVDEKSIIAIAYSLICQLYSKAQAAINYFIDNFIPQLMAKDFVINSHPCDLVREYIRTIKVHPSSFLSGDLLLLEPQYEISSKLLAENRKDSSTS